jgi:hypothetical protein
MNHRRLYNVKIYLEKFLGRSSKSIVLAEGEKTKGNPCVEIYVQGRLLESIKLKPGEDFRAGSCDNTSPADKLFFGARKKS